MDEDELDNILDKLQTRFGNMQDSAKAEVLLKHCFLMYESGATAEEFTEIVDESHEKVAKQYGEAIQVEDLTSVMFEANLQLIDDFKTVSSQMAALPAEATFDDKKKLFVRALKHEGKINVDADAMKKAMLAMVKRAVNTDAKVTGKANKTSFRRHTKLGGAGRDEGLNAFFAQGDQGQDAKGDKKGKGKGKEEDGVSVNNRGALATLVGRWGTLRATAPARAKALRRARVNFGLDAPKRIGRSPNTGVDPSRSTHRRTVENLRWRIRG